MCKELPCFGNLDNISLEKTSIVKILQNLVLQPRFFVLFSQKRCHTTAR
jgi:hypothetical protein